MVRLTVRGVENARAMQERREIPDAIMRGLYLIVQPTGRKTWAVRYRLGGKSAKHTVGPYPAFSLKQARDAAAAVLRSVAEGRAPRQHGAGAVAQAVEQFLTRHGGKRYRRSSLVNATRRLQRYVVGNWGARNLDSITRADVRAMLDGIEAPIEANRVYSIVRKFFTWAVESDLIVNSPVFGLRAPNPETSRDRILTDDELKAVWRAAEKIGYPFGSVVQLLILTGQRRSEVGGLQWSEIEGDTWVIPKERAKNARRHEVPLSKQAIAVINELPRVGDRYAITLNGEKPLNNWKKDKDRLDELAAPRDDWTLHDLRRTAASGLAKLGVSLVVIEKVLNHVSGSLAGIVGVYQRHEFADEKRAALQQWANHVEGLVS
jgi:integrase